MDFVDITDITIPEGSVEKITDAYGQVLWQKNKIILNPVWNVQPLTNLVYTGNLLDCTVSCLSANSQSGLAIMVHNTGTSEEGDTLIYSPISVSNNKVTYGTANNVANGNKLLTLCMPKPMVNANINTIIVKSNNSNYGNGAYLLVAEQLMRGTSSFGGYAVTSSPVSDTSTYITTNTEKGEYLITGFSNGLMILQTGILSSQTFHSSNLRKTCWASSMGTSGLYFGITGNDGNVSYSNDGITWNTSTVYTTTNGSKITGIEYLSNKNKICIISSNSTNIALSSDGVNWTYKQAPSSSSLCAYSPEYDAFCIWSNVKQKAYITRDFDTWLETPSMPATSSSKFGVTLPATNTNLDIKDLIHIKDGVFVGYEYLGQKLYFLSIYYPF